MPGPVGKRSDQKHGHRTASELAVDKVPAGSELVWYEPNPDWDDTAARLYASVQVSGQVWFYEQSDVAVLYYLCEEMTRSRNSDKFSGQAFQAIMSSMGDLLVTEGSRRRVKIELQRETGSSGPSDVDDAIRELSEQFG